MANEKGNAERYAVALAGGEGGKEMCRGYIPRDSGTIHPIVIFNHEGRGPASLLFPLTVRHSNQTLRVSISNDKEHSQLNHLADDEQQAALDQHFDRLIDQAEQGEQKGP